jgi:energy-coupling factor transporter ATP-binding protein EcfA2
MRLQADKIKCVTVDEPSSALDPQGELELFQKLRDARAGKTMIFVTHRFGHLTKHADLIMSVTSLRLLDYGVLIISMTIQMYERWVSRRDGYP